MLAATLIILLFSIVFFVSGKFRSDMVALCSLLALVLYGVLTPSEAFSGFSNNVVIMMIGLFIVGGGVFRTGLAKMISSKILKLAGGSELKLFLFTVLLTAFIGAFVSNTGTVALMLPITVSIAMSSNINTGRLLMPMAFASSMGGMLTLIGTPPNLVISEKLHEAGYGELSFFAFTPIGLICVAVGVLLMIPLSKIFLNKEKHTNVHRKNKTLQQLAKEYQLAEDLFRVKIPKDSPAVDKLIRDLDTSRYNLTISEIRREHSSISPFLKTMNQLVGEADSLLLPADVLYIKGNFEDVCQFSSEYGLQMIDSEVSEENTTPNVAKTMNFSRIGIAEVILMPNSSLIHCEVKKSSFRSKYGVNILGIRRGKEYILANLPEEKMEAGDTLLVQGTWENIARLTREIDEWVVVGQPLEEASKVTLDHKAPLAAIIMALMILSMSLNILAPVTAVILAAVLMVMSGCLRNVEEAYKTINWESTVLIAAMLPMSLALEKTGISGLISDFFVGNLGGMGPYAVLAGVYFTASLMTMFISNTATAVLLAPIALKTALDLGLTPHALLFAVSIGTSMCFASPFSTPPNALVMPAGKYSFVDYLKVGVPLQVIMGIVMVVVLPLLFPMQG